MIDRTDRKGRKISQLGFGVMRLPRIAGSKEIDVARSVALLREAYAKGINYFDTAYIYDGGKNEEVLGEAVKPFRKKIAIATKIPPYMVRSPGDFDRVLNKSLSRLKTDYIDYYLVHAVMDFDSFERLEAMGFSDWVRRKKEAGTIINIGFSFHGKCDDFIKIIDAYDWDFCQIQYNYWDINFQAGQRGLDYASQKGVPVIVMEPLRGGTLITAQPPEAMDAFKACHPERTMAEWGLRFVWDQPGVLTVLSGMSDEKQLAENLLTAEAATPLSLTPEERACYETSRLKVLSMQSIGCTGCGYCQPCPYGVAIPGCFSSYNDYKLFHRLNWRIKYIWTVGGLSANPGFASQCKACGACEKKCPQGLPIIKLLQKVRRQFEFPLMIPVLRLIGKVKRRKAERKKAAKNV